MYEIGFYFDRIAAAYVRGVTFTTTDCAINPERLYAQMALSDLKDRDCEEIVRYGLKAGVHLTRFAKTTNFPRITRVLSFLKGIEPSNLLDLGSGRGAFLWPLLDAFPDLDVTAVDRYEDRARMYKAVSLGGYPNLKGAVEDATHLSYASDSFDVVTMLDVLEHIPEAMRALTEAVRVARRYVIISVPVHDSIIPEHIHIFNGERLNDMLLYAGVGRVTIDTIGNHLIAIGRLKAV